jgi:hypothetical protein
MKGFEKIVFALLLFVCTVVYTQENPKIETEIKRVIDSFANAVLDNNIRRMEISIEPILLDGAAIKTPSGLSDFLDFYLRRYAPTSGAFSVVAKTRGTPPKGRLAGSYFHRTSYEDITIQLISADNIVIHTESFVIQAQQLELEGISPLPENRKTMDDVLIAAAVLEPILETSSDYSTTDFYISIDANHENKTFYDGDRLVYTLFANKDCYFTLYLLDAEGNLAKIYPLTANHNTFLPANQAWQLPGYFLMKKPYGEEVVIIVASTSKNENTLTQLPAIPATREAISRISRGQSYIEDAPTPKVNNGLIATAFFNYTILPKNNKEN